jgi:hypothetical protein
LSRIGKIGRTLCRENLGRSETDPAGEGLEAEARLFFDVLAQDYRSAFSSLDRLEALTDAPDRLARLLVVRAQVLMGLEEFDGVREALSYLTSKKGRPTSRIEFTPAGVELTALPDVCGVWGAYLESRLEERVKAVPSPGTNSEAMPEPPSALLQGGIGGGVPVALPRGVQPIADPDLDPDLRVRFVPRRPPAVAPPAPTNAPAPDAKQRSTPRRSRGVKRAMPE